MPPQHVSGPRDTARPSLSGALRAHARTQPAGLALVEHDIDRRAVTWAELDRMVDAWATVHRDLGLVAGDRIALDMPNAIEAVCAWLGAMRDGLVVVPLNPGYTDVEIGRILDHIPVSLAILDHPRELGAGVRTADLSELGARAAALDPAPVDEPEIDPEQIAAIIHTSGSEGEPRGAMLSHRALLAACRMGDAFEVREAIVLGLLPLFHVYGLNAVLNATLYGGGTVVLLRGLPDNIAQIIFDERISHLPLTPSALYRVLGDDQLIAATGSLRLVSSGAAPMPAVLGERFARLTGLRLEQGYGLTEAAPGVASTIGCELLGPGHVGRALPGVEIRIAAEGDGPGEIQIRGDNLFSGYWPDGAGGPDVDGWYDTGDLGHLQGEDLFLTDRAREIIIVSGFNVFPSEVESVLEQAPSVTSAAVVGQPDELTGERVVAFLEGKRVRPAAVRAYAREHLARYKLPSDWVVVKSLPRSVTGKVRKGQLRDMLDRVEEDL